MARNSSGLSGAIYDIIGVMVLRACIFGAAAAAVIGLVIWAVVHFLG